MRKVDCKKELKHLYKPSAKEVEIVDVPQMNFLMIDIRKAAPEKWKTVIRQPMA